MKIVILASYAFSLTNFRRELIGEMTALGHEVVACAPEEDAEVIRSLAEMGVRYRRIGMHRTGLDPISDLCTLAGLVRLIRSERPDIVLAYTQKPIIYGGIAARLVGGVRFYAMVSGLGYVFTDASRRRFLQRVTGWLYRLATQRAAAVILFNRDDEQELTRRRILDSHHHVVHVPGSGIDTARFRHRRVPVGGPIFLMIARLLHDKGIAEFVEAARQVRVLYPFARFQLLGPPDPNPAGIPLSQVASWNAQGTIEYLGATRDVRPHLARASVFVLPSYREGLPRTVLEAMATGRAIITTDAPGCRDTVEPGLNGFLVPVRNASALATAMTEFVRDPELAIRMGSHSRRLAEAHFDVARVNALLLSAIGLTTPQAPAMAPRPPERAAVLAGQA